MIFQTAGTTTCDEIDFLNLDFEYDEKTGKELFEIGMELLAKDKEAVIEYVIKKALKYTAEFEKEGKKKASKKSSGNNF